MVPTGEFAQNGFGKTCATPRVWSDKKHLAKKAAGAARRSASATGGGPSVASTLSQVELKILSIMGEGFGEPETGARVPAFPLLPPVRDPEPVATSPTHAASHLPTHSPSSKPVHPLRKT